MVTTVALTMAIMLHRHGDTITNKNLADDTTSRKKCIHQTMIALTAVVDTGHIGSCLLYIYLMTGQDRHCNHLVFIFNQ